MSRTPRPGDLLVRFLGPQRALIAGGLLLLAGSSVTTVLSPRLLGYTVDLALLPRRWDLFVLLLLGWAASEVTRVVLSVYQARVFGLTGQRLMHDLRQAIFGHFLALPLPALDRLPRGELLSRLNSDVATLSGLFTASFVSVLEKMCTLVITVTAMFVLNAQLALLALAFFSPFFLLAFIVVRKLHGEYALVRERTGAVGAMTAESISGAAVLKSFDATDRRLLSFARLSDDLAEREVAPAKLLAVLHPVVSVVNALSVCALLLIGGPMVMRGDLAAGVLVTLLTYSLWLFWPLLHVISNWSTFMAGLASARRIADAFSWPLENDQAARSERGLPTTGEVASGGARFRGEITFEHVWFSYEDDLWVLKDISFHLNPGERLTVLGPTGSGKSTLVALLLCFYGPQRGTVCVDGVPLVNLSIQLVRSRIGFVQQEPFLYGRTVHDAIFLGNSPRGDSGDNAKLRYIERFNLDPAGSIDSLSVGQRQVVAFARELARHPDVWILDEAAAHLDDEAFRIALECIEAEGPKTVIRIAHKLTRIDDGEKVMILHHGKIVEFGTRAELSAKNGVFRTMLERHLEL